MTTRDPVFTMRVDLEKVRLWDNPHFVLTGHTRRPPQFGSPQDRVLVSGYVYEQFAENAPRFLPFLQRADGFTLYDENWENPVTVGGKRPAWWWPAAEDKPKFPAVDHYVRKVGVVTLTERELRDPPIGRQRWWAIPDDVLGESPWSTLSYWAGRHRFDDSPFRADRVARALLEARPELKAQTATVGEGDRVNEWVVIDRRNLMAKALNPALKPDFRIRARTPDEKAERGPKMRPLHAPPLIFPTYEAARVHVVAIVDDWERRTRRHQADYNLAQ